MNYIVQFEIPDVSDVRNLLCITCQRHFLALIDVYHHHLRASTVFHVVQ